MEQHLKLMLREDPYLFISGPHTAGDLRIAN